MNGKVLLSKARSQDEEMQLKAKMMMNSSKILGIDLPGDAKTRIKPKSSQKAYVINKNLRGKSETVKQLIGVMKNQEMVIANRAKENDRLYRLVN